MKTKTILTLLLAMITTIGVYAGAGHTAIDSDQSTVVWKAKKVGGAHDGQVTIANGHIGIEEGALTGGHFTIDMSSIICTDIENENMNAKLVGHLKSDDFFGVEKYPTAKLVITDVEDNGNESYTVTADLTIKETTAPITFDAQMAMEDGIAVANATITIDRTVYDVRYGSKKFFDNLGDKFIYDNFDLEVKLVTASK